MGRYIRILFGYAKYTIKCRNELAAQLSIVIQQLSAALADENAYVAANPDVAAAVAASGGQVNGLEHYVLYGRAEGRHYYPNGVLLLVDQLLLPNSFRAADGGAAAGVPEPRSPACCAGRRRWPGTPAWDRAYAGGRAERRAPLRGLPDP